MCDPLLLVRKCNFKRSNKGDTAHRWCVGPTYLPVQGLEFRNVGREGVREAQVRERRLIFLGVEQDSWGVQCLLMMLARPGYLRVSDTEF